MSKPGLCHGTENTERYGYTNLKNPRKTEGKSSTWQVFYDPTSHRLVYFTIFSILFIVLAVAWLVFFIAHLYNSHLPPHAAGETSVGTGNGSITAPRYPSGREFDPTIFAPAAPETSKRKKRTDAGLPAAPPSGVPKPAVHAFIPHWSLAGSVEARAKIATIDVLMPEWFSVGRETGEIVDLRATGRDDLLELWFQNRQRVRLLPVARTGLNDRKTGAEWLASASKRAELARQASSIVVDKNLDGLCFDVSRAPTASADAIAAFAQALKSEFVQAAKESCIIVAIDDPLTRRPDAADLADRLIVLAFQEPGPYSGPAPLAAQRWYEDQLLSLLNRLPAEELVVAFGNFGMDWISGEPNPDYLNFFDITEAVSRHGGEIVMDSQSLNATASFTDSQKRRHRVWFLEALSAHNQLVQLPLDRLGGVAIWPVSGGDPGVWDILSPGFQIPISAPFLLQDIHPPSQIRYIGKGPLLTVRNSAAPGQRILSTDPESGLITDAHYVALPREFTVALSGTLPDNSVILTFDDGPSRTYTPKILDILKDYRVPAVFFVVGSRVQNSPDIARRIVEEGHELGVHTYSHPNIAGVSDLRLTLELHATQELIESVSGQSTNLFRAPYGFDENPKTPEEARVLSLLSKERYVVVGIEIDSSDWMRPGTNKIVETVTTLVEAKQGNVILFHDAGGNREQTVQALPKIIEALQDMGVSIVPLSSITGPHTLIAPAGVTDNPDQISKLSFWLIRTLKTAITVIFVFVITVGIVRSLTILALALIKERRVHKSGDAALPVTVIIPAYCEETVIAKSVKSVLQSTYPVDQVVVVDDGSTDGTAHVVSETFASDPRVRLVRQDNKGKSEALNHAIGLVETPIVVAIDADTIISPDAIGLLVRHFNDERVGAVAGNVKVGNRVNLLTRLQAIEYITAQNLDRRAFEVLNGIMVVPGSIGGWRTEAIISAGGYSSETIVEDADLTVSIMREDYKVVYEPAAHAFTEAPQTIRQWMRQRLRWHFGMLQIAWKHKSAALERRAVGLVSIPDLVLFGAVFSLFAPIADLVMFINLFKLAAQLTDPPILFLENTSFLVAIAYAAYLMSDLVLATIAFGLEPDEDKRLLPWVLTQRFFYRQIYWMVALRSIARAVTGQFTGWRKITRMSSIDPAHTLGRSRAHGRTVSTGKIAQPGCNLAWRARSRAP
ncbi:polysaccharide deacetylase family protein [Ovoidimarina sediminis]|uniref:polysaccharide deacetylase family protein n=1 Tax=Ovoidimarina sediminis TaxID=3079856 RepID=UPI00290751CA|nr:polysaccharide deacetylase family protein [Rhodophyticola sp. MJ-SS7]MDU8945953.1 polysaccharide deacetylase family protein [Rhodophyticola sp. MJ-SS7]